MDDFVKGESHPPTPLNGSLQIFNTLRLSVGSGKLWRDFCGNWAPTKFVNLEPGIYLHVLNGNHSVSQKTHRTFLAVT